MKLIPVPADDLEHWEEKIGWHLEQFAADGAWAPEDFLSQIRDGTRQLWIAFDGAVKAVMLTSVDGDRLKTTRITHCAGGNMEEWAFMFPWVAGWARENGSKRIEGITRPGWERVLKQYGMKKTHVVLEVRLDG